MSKSDMRHAAATTDGYWNKFLVSCLVAGMAWTSRDDLRLSIRIGLTRGLRLVRGMRRQLTEAERDRVAEAIADHLHRANWRIESGRPLTGHGDNFDFRPKPPPGETD